MAAMLGGEIILWQNTSRYLYEARKEAAAFFNIRPSGHFIYTLNATESANIVIKGLLNPGDHVIYSALEHNAVWRPLKEMEQQGIMLTEIAIPPDRYASLDDWEEAITPCTKLFVVNHGSNVTGHIAPLKELCHLAYRYNIAVLSDMAQTTGVLPIDVVDIGLDYAAFAGHKSLQGPGGIGGLYVREEGVLRPLKTGGTGTHSESPKHPVALPTSLECGTLNMAGVGGLRAGIAEIRSQTQGSILAREAELTEQFLRGIADMPHIVYYGPPPGEPRTPVVSLNVGDWPPQKVSSYLQEKADIAVRTGLHCSPLAHKTINTLLRGTVRFSFGLYSSSTEIDIALNVLDLMKKEL